MYLQTPIHNHKKQHVYSNWSTGGKFGEDIAKIPSLTITRLYQEVVVCVCLTGYRCKLRLSV